jgi:peptidoglycan/xylan/chitin deacetylase (PgdA/CDA1 family)
MRGVNDLAIRFGLDTLYYSGIYRLIAPISAGRGIIFCLHRVRSATQRGSFAPNAVLEITPEFLSGVLRLLRRRGIDIVDLDEAAARLESGEGDYFAAFTFDDGYADSFTAAVPLFEAAEAPYTIFVTPGLIDHRADVWWLTLEESIRRLDRVRVSFDGCSFDLAAASNEAKQAAWDAVYWPLRDCTVEERRDAVQDLARQAGVSEEVLCRDVAMDRAMVHRSAAHPLVTIGAHTLTHPPLRALGANEARREIVESRVRLEREVGMEVRHFAYPFGDPDSAGPREFALARDAGFRTAVTTRKGPLLPGYREHLHALPRVSLNGNYQDLRYLDLFLSGAPFALFNRGLRLDVA